MKKLIIIKYGEMTTKKDNIGLFLRKLKIVRAIFSVVFRMFFAVRSVPDFSGRSVVYIFDWLQGRFGADIRFRRRRRIRCGCGL